MRVFRLARSLLGLVVPLSLAACGDSLTQTLGLDHGSPDEFQVTTRAPLSMPTDFSLPPPRPGAQRPQEPAAEVSALAALVPSVELSTRVAPDTPGQDALVAASGPAAPPGIRQRLDAEEKQLNSNTGIGTTLAFWKKPPPPGKVIDPVKEAAHLRSLGIATITAPGPEAGGAP